MATYSLDQKASNQTDQGGQNRSQAANDNSGYHNSVINYIAGGDLSAETSSSSGGIGQAMSELPVWMWIGLAVIGLIWVLKKRRK